MQSGYSLSRLRVYIETNTMYSDPNSDQIFLEEMQSLFANKWLQLICYLNEEKDKGKTEFRIALQGNMKFIVHPLSKDGKTVDFEY